MYARYKNNNMSSEVNLASQTHHAPHIGLPQIAPDANAMIVKAAPIGAETFATTSAILICQMSPIPPAIAMIA